MAKTQDNERKSDRLRNKSSAVTYGMDEQLDDESSALKNIIQQTIVDTKKKYGERTNEKPISYFNEINFGNAFSELFGDNKKDDKNTTDESRAAAFKRYMSENNTMDIGAIMAEEAGRTIQFSNYRLIHQHIPECAQALQIYKDNIMSPDDYTKLIFNVNYEKTVDDNIKELVKERLNDLTIKYQIEDKADEIIEETLELGESYYAVLSLEDELGMILDSKKTSLNEADLRVLDKNSVDVPILSENIEISNDELETLNEMFISSDNSQMSKEIAQKKIAECVNQNVIIGSPKELFLEKFEAESQQSFDIPDLEPKKKKGKKSDNKPMYLNGSILRYLRPEKVVELRIDDVCYGYYYAEEVASNIPQETYLGTSSGRSVNSTLSIAQNNTIGGVNTATYRPATTAASQLNVGESKLKAISNLFLNAISKKIDKDFVRKNKQFKDFIYDLVRQDYIIKKGIKLTYFKPDEVIKFECTPIYRDITFFAKLYLSILTNNLLIKLGRAHDKRVFYVNVGTDGAYEQAIQGVIEDIKTKDYKMENLNDFNTVLNLAPGRFDDYFMPSINGEHPVEIETIPGMDVDMNNEFVEYLKNSMMSGMGVPRNLIDVTAEVDYARSISAMNSNFVRSVIRYQKKFTPSFTRLYQKLYENEYRYVNDSEQKMENIDISAIRVQFPSPATLAMTNISEQIQSADSNADFISTQIIPPKNDGSNEEERIRLKSAIVKDLLPSIDWEKYTDMRDEIKREMEKEKIENKANPVPSMDESGFDPNGNYNGMY